MAPVEESHAQRVLSSLNRQRALGRFCDAALSTGGGKVFPVHRSVLACFSELFEDPGGSAAQRAELALPEDCPAKGLELLLDFIYTGELSLDAANLEQVRRAAASLSVPDALDMCREFASEGSRHAGRCGEQLEAGAEDERPRTRLPEDASGPESGVTEKPGSRPAARPRPKTTSCLLKQLIPSPAARLVSASAATTTRSGRRVRGPSRLLGESPATPAREVEPGVSEAKRGTEGEGEACERHVKETAGLSTEELSNDHEDEDGGELEVLPDDTDEEYLPHAPPSTSMTSQRVKRRVRGKAVNKENGEGAARDSKRSSVQCPTCQKTFLSKYYLKVHNRRHTGEKPFECSKCGKCYYRKENLLEHEARNCLSRTEVVFSCNLCPMTFRRRLELRLHTVTHTGEMPNKCTSCSEQFMQKKDLKIHLIKVHGAPKPHACSLCPKCFLSRTELRLHEASKHRGEKLFVCEECGHRASSRNGLQMHIKAIHRNERPFVCEFCKHAFTQKANLNMHLRTHTGEKPFQCHLCGKTFRTQASLDKHHRTHTGERPFRCEYCDQRFTEKGPLLRHVASKHQEGRPHYCHICSKTFKAIEQLRVHVRRHKGMRKFECTECGYKFTRQAHLRRHSQIHNRVENYNPRQRRLRNLVVDDEKATGSSLTPEAEGPPPGDIINVMIQPDAIMVEEVVSSQGASSGDGEREEEEEPGFPVADVMEQTLLVSGAYPIHDSSVVTEELVEDGPPEKG
ncbi:telomere zinc finger-associated protein [Scleropages formosus]|uniref:Zinc finger and BTB domain containing 48 n=1 Tax=Scleropages formosus TaxID=113540 RepID=A0A8C9VVM0_SCLFO|nr:telomere zinc finger-associated protein [Scleropages formosus]